MALAEDNNEAEVSLIDEVSEEFAIAAETPSQNVIISTGYENYGLGDVSVSDSDFYNVFDDIHDYSYDNSYSGTTVLNSIDLSTTSYFPPIGNQGGYGSCVSWATTYYQFTYEANKLNGITTTSSNAYSPAWMFNMLNGGTDSGSTNQNAYWVLKHQGALKMSEVPYYPYNHDFSWSNNTEALVEALDTRLSSENEYSLNTSTNPITSRFDTDLNEIKAVLCAGKIVNIEVASSGGLGNWHTKTISYGGSTGDVAVCYATSSYAAGHAMTIVGYDDYVYCDMNDDGLISANERGAFKVANSWGTGWCNSGYVWVMYDALNITSTMSAVNVPGRIAIFDRSNGNNNKFYTIEVANYNVNMVGLLDINVTRRYGLNIFTGRDSASNLDLIIDSTKTGGAHNNASFNGTIVVDYLDCDDNIMANLSKNWFVRVQNVSGVTQNSSFSYRIVDNKLNIIKNFGTIANGILDNSTVTTSRNIVFQKGDLNYDGLINSNDALIIQKYDANMIELSNIQTVLGDMNEDGVINLTDAVAILMGG